MVRYIGEASVGQALLVADELGGHRLLASQCPECGDVRLPPRQICPNDLSECEPLHLDGNGEIYETVRIGLAPQGFEAPFWVGYIDLDGGARFFAQIGWAEGEREPRHGDRVSMSVEVLSSDGEPLFGPIFRRIDSHVAH